MPDEPMTQARWSAMPERERAAIRDLSDLTPALVGLEGCRVEVERHPMTGERGRFIVSRSTGWRPVHIALANVRSSGGIGIGRNCDLGRITVIRRGVR